MTATRSQGEDRIPPNLPEQWRSPEWCDLSAGSPPPGRVRIGTALVLARYAEGNPEYSLDNWYLSAHTNGYRLGILDAWLPVLRRHHGLSLLQLPAGFLRGGDGWDLERARSGLVELARKHGVSLLVGFDHAVEECPEGLEDDWPHQHALFAQPDGALHAVEKQWFVTDQGGLACPLVPPQARQWHWEGLRAGVAVCHDLAGLVHGSPQAHAPAVESPIDLLLNPRHVNTTRENRPVGWGRLAVTLQRIACQFHCAVATSMLFRALSPGSGAERFAYRCDPPRTEAEHWQPVAQPYLWAGSEVVAWFQILQM